MDYRLLLENLKKAKILHSPLVIGAFERANRADFLPAEFKGLAGENTALPIGFGQTISQPQVVAFMMELLGPRPGDKILDVGAGSGWTSAILAEIVGRAKGGEVIAAERISGLCDLARANLKKYGYEKKDVLKIVCADASKALTKGEYFDKIISAASSGEIPPEWKKELKIGGRIVASVGASIALLVKKSEDEFEEKEFPGFLFVPLIKD